MSDPVSLLNALQATEPAPGSVLGVRGDVVRLALQHARLGEWLQITSGPRVEVAGFDGTEALALPLDPMAAVHSGQGVRRIAAAPCVVADASVIGRVLDGLGEALDEGPTLPAATWPISRPAPPLLSRRPVDEVLPLGVRALDALCTVGKGQRLALEAGPGVGKTTLLGQIAAQAQVDVVVIGLIGERGREVGDFLARLPEAARDRCVVVVARADDPPQRWLRAAEACTAIAERFREQGRDVLLLMDSLTRVARAIRTVGVATGEPVTRRGYPASLSSRIARLVARATNDEHGTLTALYTVLVEGDAIDDPVAEEARALLDGHLVLDRALAGAGHFPAVQITASVSRCMEAVADPEHRRAAVQLRRMIAALERVADLVRVGAYAPGSDPDADRALARAEAIERFLRQPSDEASDLATTLAALRQVVQ